MTIAIHSTEKATPGMMKALSCEDQILVINTAANVSQCLAQCLVQQGYNCTFVDSDSEADALLEHKHFDVIVYSGESSVVIKRYSHSGKTVLYAS